MSAAEAETGLTVESKTTEKVTVLLTHLHAVTSDIAMNDDCMQHDMCGKDIQQQAPVLQVGKVKGSAAGPDVAVLVHVHLVVWCDQTVRSDVKLAPTNQQRLLNILLNHPL